ncbi:MAG: Bpu10I family restriction endonuclease [Marinilabiliaceae bacterium]|nr:Bpu10I family restriction endonuclease [Marinilabiliaceae bacterium]
MNYFNETTLRDFLIPLKSNYIHASNIFAKLNKKDCISFLLNCAEKYKIFHENFSIDDLQETVNEWNNYLNYVQKNNPYTAQSKFEPTILEESMYRLFANFENEKIRIGNIKAYSNLYFSPLNFADFQEKSTVKINSKDQDFAIYKRVNIQISDNERTIDTFIPVVAFECKTYLDKTMLEGSIATAEKIKNGNPYCRFCIVTEFYEVDKKVDIKHSRIDQIYVLNKDAKRKSSKFSNISLEVVQLLQDDTQKHLNTQWSDVEQNIKNKGIVL